MGIREVWNALEAVMVERGFPLADSDEIPQSRRCAIRVSEIPSEQPIRGAVGGGRIRVSFVIEVALFYDITPDKRLDRKVAEDAEDVIAAIYHGVNLSNHQFLGATVDRNAAQGMVTTTIRFAFQTEAA